MTSTFQESKIHLELPKHFKVCARWGTEYNLLLIIHGLNTKQTLTNFIENNMPQKIKPNSALCARVYEDVRRTDIFFM